MAPATNAITIAEALEIEGITAHELAIIAGVATSTVMRAMIPGGPYKTNLTCAAKIAEALGLEIHEIMWANGTSPLGRPADTAVPIGKVAPTPCYNACPVHFTTLPASGICDECA